MRDNHGRRLFSGQLLGICCYIHKEEFQFTVVPLWLLFGAVLVVIVLAFIGAAADFIVYKPVLDELEDVEARASRAENTSGIEADLTRSALMGCLNALDAIWQRTGRPLSVSLHLDDEALWWLLNEATNMQGTRSRLLNLPVLYNKALQDEHYAPELEETLKSLGIVKLNRAPVARPLPLPLDEEPSDNLTRSFEPVAPPSDEEELDEEEEE